jgi:hypothetical protein
MLVRPSVTPQLAKMTKNYSPSDLRKFAEQHGDVVGWNESNRAFILTHGVRGIEWSNYQYPLPEHVYDVYIKYWGLSTFLVHMNCDLSSQNSSG